MLRNPRFKLEVSYTGDLVASRCDYDNVRCSDLDLEMLETRPVQRTNPALLIHKKC